MPNNKAQMSGRRDSNPRPSAWKADALPTELLPRFYFKCVDVKIGLLVHLQSQVNAQNCLFLNLFVF